jgi:hypothetical protein
MNKQEIIKYLKENLKDMKEHKDGMDDKSWGMEYGIIISGNEAKLILKELEKHDKR